MAVIHVSNKADFTSEKAGPLKSRSNDDYPVNIRFFAWGDFGTAGTASIEVEMPDGTYQTFPELSFSTATGQTIELFEGAIIRVVVAGCVSVSATIEI